MCLFLFPGLQLQTLHEYDSKVIRSMAKEGTGQSKISNTEEQKALRQEEVIIYRAQQIDSESADDRKSDDKCCLCININHFRKVALDSGDIEKMHRLGRRKELAQLVKCSYNSQNKIYTRHFYHILLLYFHQN